MGLVASSKIRRATEAMVKSREYVASVQSVIERLASSRECMRSPYMQVRSSELSRTRIIVIAGDRGLAGGYNANIFRFTAAYAGAQFIPIGKRACDKFGEGILSAEHCTAADISTLSHRLCAEFASGEFDRLGIISTRYVSMLSQEPFIQWLLPLTKADGVPSSGTILFEPDEIDILNAAVPTYVTGLIVGAVRESFTSEVAARRTAMDSAGKNAAEMIDRLQLQYNRARQGAITQEITEIVAGAGN